MPDNHYENTRLAGLYDITCPWSVDRDFYLTQAGPPPQNVLDLGCGTGLLCDAYAALGHDVTGVDPALSMLDVAKTKPNGDRITWVHSTAEDYRSDTRFDLMIMTGHAFQVLLTDEAVAAAFATMRMHLKPDGNAVFESRNPGFDWATVWEGEKVHPLGQGEFRVATRMTGMEPGFLSFEQTYHLPDETLSSDSRLRFLSRGEIEERLVAAGLRIAACYGDWHRGPFDEGASREMIFVVRAAG